MPYAETTMEDIIIQIIFYALAGAYKLKSFHIKFMWGVQIYLCIIVCLLCDSLEM